jgi:hypothetical protein
MSRVVYTSPNLSIPDGVDGVHERITPSNELLVCQMHGRFYELCRNSNLFYVANTAGVVTAATTTATALGLCISNPAGNNKDIIIEAYGITNALAETALSNFGLMGGYTAAGVVTHTTPLAFGTAFASLNLGSPAAPTALVDAAWTAVLPRVLMMFGGNALATAVNTGQMAMIDIGGAIRLQPGAWVSGYTLTAITVQQAFWWSEEPR